MKFRTYVKIDEQNGAEILALKQRDIPLRDLLSFEAVDISSYTEFLSKNLDDHGACITAPAVNPMTPTTFTYRPSASADPVTVEGIVIGEEPSALIEFAESKLMHVDQNSRLNAIIEETSPFSSRHRRGLKLAEWLAENSREPYRAYPLLHPPSNVARNNRENMSFHRIEHDNEEVVLFPLAMIHNFRSDINCHTRHEEDYNTFSMPFYEPSYMISSKNTTHNQKKKETREQLLKNRYMWGVGSNGIHTYNWTWNDEQGAARSSDTIPIELVKTLDENGIQRSVPASMTPEMPLDFLSPHIVFTANAQELASLRESTVDREDLDRSFDRESVLSRQWFVRDVQDPVGSFNRPIHVEEPNTESGHQGKSGPVVRDPKSLAYVLQHTRDGMFDPTHTATPFRVHGLSDETVGRVLCDVNIR